jgi:hypothetical protein
MDLSGAFLCKRSSLRKLPDAAAGRGRSSHPRDFAGAPAFPFVIPCRQGDNLRQVNIGLFELRQKANERTVGHAVRCF